MKELIIRRDSVNEAIIIFCAQLARVKCDRRCDKAWGASSRPQTNGRFVSDQEFGFAPTDPVTLEGEHGKPLHPDEFPNKWCVRECERCAMSEPGAWENELELKTF